MTSDSDDVEEALQENLKPRGELADEVVKSKVSSRSQRVSPDFHRLGLMFALIAGAIDIVLIARDAAMIEGLSGRGPATDKVKRANAER
jgi:hypothetical protein